MIPDGSTSRGEVLKLFLSSSLSSFNFHSA
jgi:hypothetical protein